VRLLDATGELVAETTTDSNGYYGFGAPAGNFILAAELPDWARFSPRHAAAADLDSDLEPATGMAGIRLDSDDLSVDIGIAPLPEVAPPAAPLPAEQIGPIRSGRLVYGYIARSFDKSCLIFGGASPEVLSHLPACHVVFHQTAGGGFMLGLDELGTIARDNADRRGNRIDYPAAHVSAVAPDGGASATRLDVYYAYQNQSAWVFDPLYGAYLRYVDSSIYDQAGIVHPDTDRLTGRQLFFENVVVVFAEHDVISPTNIDIRLNPGRTGRAMIFRDGRAYDAEWDTRQSASNNPRPMQFRDRQGESFPLKPGRTWMLVVTPESTLTAVSPPLWRLRFAPPPGAE
jgi:hypothetical protein